MIYSNTIVEFWLLFIVIVFYTMRLS